MGYVYGLGADLPATGGPLARVIVASDNETLRASIETVLGADGGRIEFTSTYDRLLKSITVARNNITAIVFDSELPEQNGVDVIRDLRSLSPYVPVIIVGGNISSPQLIQALRMGTSDLIINPPEHIQNTSGKPKSCTAQGANTAQAFVSGGKVPMFVYSPQMRNLQRTARTVGAHDVPVLLLGETGSGKEVIAGQIHAASARFDKPFVKLNCAALPAELVESELFGYDKGAFTGAFRQKAGLFEAADNGTVFLDEIGDMDVRLQAKLLQFLQDHEFRRVGGQETVRVNVRIIAATHRDLVQSVRNDTFREDLYYRLNVITLRVPPLRERREEVIPLAEFLLAKHASPNMEPPPLTPQLRQTLVAYNWPGNVRELENVVRRHIVMQDPDAIIHELQQRMTLGLTAGSRVDPSASVPEPSTNSPVLHEIRRAKDDAETHLILSALNSTRWNRKQAAIILKIDYKALLYKMKRLNIAVKDRKATAATA